MYLHREININYLTNDNRSAETRDDWYFRVPVDYQIEIPVNSLEEGYPHSFPIENDQLLSMGLNLCFKVLVRKDIENTNHKVVTITLCNYGSLSDTSSLRYDSQCFYQSDFQISYLKGEQQQPFLPVSENTSNPFNNNSDEAQGYKFRYALRGL